MPPFGSYLENIRIYVYFIYQLPYLVLSFYSFSRINSARSVNCELLKSEIHCGFLIHLV